MCKDGVHEHDWKRGSRIRLVTKEKVEKKKASGSSDEDVIEMKERVVESQPKGANVVGTPRKEEI